MLTIKYQTAFRKDYKRLKKRGYDMSLLAKVIGLLATGQELKEKELLLYLKRTGTHSDIF